MKYKMFLYEISDEKGKTVGPDSHAKIFKNSIGSDGAGRFAEYRGKKDSVLMYIRDYHSDFAGLIGRHSTEREVTKYNYSEDDVDTVTEEDDDYPNTPFICFPRLRSIAVVDSSKVTANSAISRLNQIIAHRQKLFFVVEAMKEPLDLRKAVKRFKVTDVTFEILPVNPHTGPLGLRLDQSRALDHIRRIKGKVEATEAKPLELNGGLLSSIQELQQSGHAKVGYRAIADGGIIINVAKPSQATELDDDDEKVVHGENVDVKVEFPGVKIQYPFQQSHITAVRTLIRRFTEPVSDDKN